MFKIAFKKYQFIRLSTTLVLCCLAGLQVAHSAASEKSWLSVWVALSSVTKLNVSYVESQPENLFLFWRYPEEQTDNDLAGKPFKYVARLKEWLQASAPQNVEKKSLPNPELQAIMNAGIYDESLRPLGLHISAGKTLRSVNRASGYGNFYLKPNGIFYIESRKSSKQIAGILPTMKYTSRKAKHWRLATQSGPLLVYKGEFHKALLPDSDSKKIRNGIGIRADGTVVLAKSNELVNFYDFARYFRDVLQCPNALYLDGTISQLWQKGDFVLPHRAYAGMLVVIE